jgi:hypothetical protein
MSFTHSEHTPKNPPHESKLPPTKVIIGACRGGFPIALQLTLAVTVLVRIRVWRIWHRIIRHQEKVCDVSHISHLSSLY